MSGDKYPIKMASCYDIKEFEENVLEWALKKCYYHY